MKQKFVSNLLFLVLLNIIIKPFYILGIDAGVQNAVGAKEYGLYFALFNLSFLLNIFSDLGITNFNNRNIAQHRQLLNKHFSSLISLRSILIVLYIIVALVSGFLLGYSERLIFLLGWIVINQALASFILFLRSNLAGLHLFKQDSIISVLDRFLLIIFCGYALWGRQNAIEFKIEWFIGLQTISYLITVVVAFLMVKGQTNKFNISFNKLFSISIIKKSLPYALLTLLMGLYHRMDSIMLERMLPHGSEASGIYAQGFRFLDALNNFSFLFAILLLPIFARMLKEKLDFNPVVLIASKLLLSGVIIISFTAHYASFGIMDWRYDENIAEASKTFGVLILSSLFFAIVLIYGTLLTADGKLKELNYLAVFGVMLNFILNFLLIPRFEAYGSALATLATQLITALGHLILAQVYFKFKINWPVILKMILLMIILIFIGHNGQEINLHWINSALLMTFVGLGSAIMLNLINPKDFVELIKSKE
ncbi:MAG: O-antigen/teichoic acid export membrane protein [Patiriisocius sp.]|jgi:O-antigen/teichoic acid export membrane protein